MIDAAHPTLSITRQCELISLSRASYYRSVDTDIGTETPENLELMRLIFRNLKIYLLFFRTNRSSIKTIKLYK
jgi:hypothetical protein